MKRFRYILASALLVMMTVTACDKYDDSEILQRLDKLEGSTINTISQQIAAIENTIKILQQSDNVFESEIEELQAYVDECRGTDKNWIETTFATLAQYNAIMDSLTAMNTLMDVSIEDVVISMQSWVNQALTGYYDIATANAKLVALEKRITAVDSVSAANVTKLQSDLLQATNDLKDAYEKAISDAITTNNGNINKKISDEIIAINTHIDTEINRIDMAIAEHEERISALEKSMAELTKVLGITFSENNISCLAGDIIKIDYTITNSNGHATVYTLSEKDYSATVETKTSTTGIITVCVPSPFVNGNILVFVNDDNKSCIAALNFIQGSMTVSTDVVEVGAEGGEVSVDVDTDLGYIVKVQDGITWLHNATVTTRSPMRHEKVTLIADASQLAFPRNAVVLLHNAAGDTLSQYTVHQAGTVSNYELVDLGLSVKWATCNVGARKPEEYGSYFAWGETVDDPYITGKTSGYAKSFDWNSYKYCRGLSSTMTKYCTSSGYGTVDNKETLELSDDAARVNCGGSWRMPTDTEIDELLNSCSWVWTTLNNVNGYMVTSNKTGYTDKSVFLPAAGFRSDVTLYYAGSYGGYWSSSLDTSYGVDAYGLFFNSGSHDRKNRDYHYRYCGRSVRPVYPCATTNINLNRQYVKLTQGETESLIATIQYENGATGNTATWSSSNNSIATVNKTGEITAVSVGTCTISAVSGLSTATCSVTVIPFEPEYVDLGLSVNWATFNVGAYKPEEYGCYFAWGETQPKSYYSFSNLKYCLDSDGNKFSKYVGNSKYGTVDNKTTLELSDDAAHANWGSNWRMPTASEIEELIANCTCEWTTLNGTNGYRITSNISGYTDKSIFLPAAGFHNSDILYSAGYSGYYWSSSLSTSNNYASVLDFSLSSINHSASRYQGRSVRPVCPSQNYVYITGVSLRPSSLSLEVGDTATLDISFTPSNASDKRVKWNSSNTSAATIDDNGTITAISAGTATITATTTNGDFAAFCTITVNEKKMADGNDNGYDYVDLGLSVKWATCNVGASTYGYGDRFAWGETATKGRYDWSSYKYSEGTSSTITKYFASSIYRRIDNKTTLELIDDVAHVKWGGNWRIPTASEFDELIDNCTWEWTTLMGTKGYRITSNISGYTDKSIFLPANGYSAGYSSNWADGHYWSSSVDTRESYNAYEFYFDSASRYMNSASRYQGLSVRPVCHYATNNISLNRQSVEIMQGGTETLTATVQYENVTTDNTATWSSSNTSIATVDQTGNITAVSVGTCSITAVSGSFSATCSVTVTPFEPQYVELGLSVNWATCNVGAIRSEEYGDYFAWGEIIGEPYIKGMENGYAKSYGWKTYKYCNGSSSSMTKYSNKATLELVDDAAHVNWGGNWRIPTELEIQELMDYCTWTWLFQNGVYGCKVTSSIPGFTNQSIFLPANGYRDGYNLKGAGTGGHYWSSSNNYDFASSLDISSDNRYLNSEFRYYGFSVRPVCPPESDRSVTGVVLVQSYLSLCVESTATLTATISPYNAANKSVTWSSNNTNVASVDANGNVTALSVGTAIITVTTTDGNFTATCTVSVMSQQSSEYKENGYDYVDLGLSVKWATCNVGSIKPEEYGDYFAWGETVGDSYINGKDRGYTKSFDWSSYIHCYGSSDNFMTKYCTSSNYGTVDNKTTLELSDDAAHVNWGGNWRIPTELEIQELMDNCTCTWTTLNGVKGYKVISKKSGYTDQFIFLPAAGYRHNESLLTAGSEGHYWSSSLYSNATAYSLNFGSVNSDSPHWREIDSRCTGLPIRPVCP